MSEAPKSPAQLMNDLTDQVRLLRQDVVNLTATATTKKEAAALRASVQTSAQEAHDRSAEILDVARQVISKSFHASLDAARDGAASAVAGMQDEVKAAADTMRLEALKASREGLYRSGGAVGVFGGLVALGAILGVVGHMWLQGRADARAFGQRPWVFCEAAGGQLATSDTGRQFCAVWVDPPVEPGNRK